MKKNIMLILALGVLLIACLLFINKPVSIGEIKKTGIDGFSITIVGGEKFAILSFEKMLRVVQGNLRTKESRQTTAMRTGEDDGLTAVVVSLNDPTYVEFEGGENCALYCPNNPCDEGPDSCPPIPVECQGGADGSIDTQSLTGFNVGDLELVVIPGAVCVSPGFPLEED